MGSGAGRYAGQALNATAPLRRDTVLIPANNWMVIRFITDNRTSSPPPVIYLLMMKKSGRLGVPLSYCVAYGGGAVDAVQ